MGWMVNATPPPLYPRECPGTPCERQGRSGLVRMSSPLTGIRSTDHPARSDSLYQMNYPGPKSVQRRLLISKTYAYHTRKHARARAHTHNEWLLDFVRNQETLAYLKDALPRRPRQTLKYFHVTRMRSGYFTQDVTSYVLTYLRLSAG